MLDLGEKNAAGQDTFSVISVAFIKAPRSD